MDSRVKMKKLVIATHNRNKFAEMKSALEGLGWEILPAFEFPGVPEVEEDGTTLEENSLKKAKAIFEFTRLPSLADDTGLFVDALNGRPGIYAARFAGEHCSYEDNVKKMLDLMSAVAPLERRATFKTVVTLYSGAGSMRQVCGEVEGFITPEARGTGGFGYDPIFLPEGETRVFAEMPLEEKNRISHRGKAVQKAREVLSQL